MRDERVSEAEVRAAIRASGIAAAEDAYAVVLKTDGTISVIQAADGLQPRRCGTWGRSGTRIAPLGVSDGSGFREWPTLAPPRAEEPCGRAHSARRPSIPSIEAGWGKRAALKSFDVEADET